MILRRENLIAKEKEKMFEDITLMSFKVDSKFLLKSAMVIFVGYDGRMKILKNRYGKTGEIKIINNKT